MSAVISRVATAATPKVGRTLCRSSGRQVSAMQLRSSALSNAMVTKSYGMGKIVSRGAKVMASASGSDAAGPGGLKIDLRGA